MEYRVIRSGDSDWYLSHALFGGRQKGAQNKNHKYLARAWWKNKWRYAYTQAEVKALQTLGKTGSLKENQKIKQLERESKAAKKTTDKIEKQAAAKIKKTVNDAGTAVKGKANTLGGAAKKAADTVSNKVGKAAYDTKKAANTFVDDVKSGVTAKQVKIKAETAKNDIANAAKNTPNAVKETVSNTASKVKSTASSVKGKVDKAVSDFKNYSSDVDKRNVEVAKELRDTKLVSKAYKKVADEFADQYNDKGRKFISRVADTINANYARSVAKQLADQGHDAQDKYDAVQEEKSSLKYKMSDLASNGKDSRIARETSSKITATANKGKDALNKLFNKAGDTAKSTAEKATETAKNAASKASDAAERVAKNVSSKVSDTASKAGNAISNTVNSVAEKGRTKAEELINRVSGSAKNAADKVSDAASKAGNTVSNAAKNAAQSVSDKANQISSDNKEYKRLAEQAEKLGRKTDIASDRKQQMLEKYGRNSNEFRTAAKNEQEAFRQLREVEAELGKYDSTAAARVDRATDAISDTAKNAANKVGNVAKSVSEKGKATAEKGKSKAEELLGKVSDAASKAGNTVSNAASKVGNAASDTASKAGNAISDAASKTYSKAKDSFDTALSTMREATSAENRSAALGKAQSAFKKLESAAADRLKVIAEKYGKNSDQYQSAKNSYEQIDAMGTAIRGGKYGNSSRTEQIDRMMNDGISRSDAELFTTYAEASHQLHRSMTQDEYDRFMEEYERKRK